MDRDLEHLKLLAIFHFVLAGLTAIGALIPIVHLLIGVALLGGFFDQGSGGPPPRVIGLVFVAVATFAILFGLALAGILAFAGRCLLRHSHYRYCFVVAVVSCLWVPLGTILGVFTIVVLSRERVQALFAGTGLSGTGPER